MCHLIITVTAAALPPGPSRSLAAPTTGARATGDGRRGGPNGSRAAAGRAVERAIRRGGHRGEEAPAHGAAAAGARRLPEGRGARGRRAGSAACSRAPCAVASRSSTVSRLATTRRGGGARPPRSSSRPADTCRGRARPRAAPTPRTCEPVSFVRLASVERPRRGRGGVYSSRHYPSTFQLSSS